MMEKLQTVPPAIMREYYYCGCVGDFEEVIFPGTDPYNPIWIPISDEYCAYAQRLDDWRENRSIETQNKPALWERVQSQFVDLVHIHREKHGRWFTVIGI